MDDDNNMLPMAWRVNEWCNAIHTCARSATCLAGAYALFEVGRFVGALLVLS